jgi:hypothetical protein
MYFGIDYLETKGLSLEFNRGAHVYRLGWQWLPEYLVCYVVRKIFLVEKAVVPV